MTMSKIEIAVDTPESEQFCAWLNAQGHDARVGNSTGNYIDGVLCHGRQDDDGEAGTAMNSLWTAYCDQPAA
jgi:hypothetical protein